VLLLELSKGAAKQGKGAGKEEFPEHLLLFETPPLPTKEDQNRKCNQCVVLGSVSAL